MVWVGRKMKPVRDKMHSPVELIKGKALIEKKQVGIVLWNHVWNELFVEINVRFEPICYLIEYDITGWND